MLEVMEPLSPKFGDTPSIPIDREVWCVNGISNAFIFTRVKGKSKTTELKKHNYLFSENTEIKIL